MRLSADFGSELIQLGAEIADEQAAETRAALRGSSRPLPVLALAEAAARRTSQRMAGSPDEQRRACKAGCSACCHLAVAVTVPEALLIAARLREQRTAIEFAGLCEKIAATSARVSDLTIEARAEVRIPCALLGQDGACTVYHFRPIGCRGYTSFSKNACDAALAAAEPGHDGPMDRVAWTASGAVTEGLTRALRELCVDPGHYEFHSAVLRAIETPAAEQRWARGEDLFSDCGQVKSLRLQGPQRAGRG